MRRICMSIIILWALLPVLLTGSAAAEEIRTRDAVPQITMNVLEPGIKTASVALKQEHDWYIQCVFPRNTDISDRYTVIQTLSPGLTYLSGSVEVCFLKTDRERIPFAMGEAYSLTAGTVFVEGGIADRISIALTEIGSTQLAEGGELWIRYRARISETAAMGTQLLGTAQLNCLDAEGNRTVCLSDKAVVSTGGFHIRLTDAAGFPLSGGEFMVAREAAQEELEDDSLLIELLDTGEETIAVVYEPFCPSEDLTEHTVYMVKTDREGKAVCYGLAYGTYYLVQTQAGEGTGLPAKPVKVQVNEVSHLTLADGWEDGSGIAADHTVRLVNGELVMPQTGGPGTYGYEVAGMLVILSACMLLWNNRKRKILR